MTQHPCPKCGSSMARNGKTPGGKQVWICKRQGADAAYCYKTTNPQVVARDRNSKPLTPAVSRGPFPRAERYVVTWAQNATPVHKDFLACLLTFCEAHDAQLLVIPGRYKNPTSRWSASQENAEHWAKEVEPYLVDKRVKLNASLSLVADLKIQPTAVSPLTGFEGLTGPESAIVGHPKVQFKTVPTPANKMAKVLTTTGSVTVRNYSDTRAGKGGEFHHVLGAVLVEVVSRKVFHLHHLHYSEKHKGFIHLDRAYFADRWEPAPPAPALVFGDAHVRFADPEVVRATFGPGGLVDRLNPTHLVFHDVLDAYAVNPHHAGNPFNAIAKRKGASDDIEKEVRDTAAAVCEWAAGRVAVIVPSNHDDMLHRWVVREDWKRDPVNAEFYLETALQMVRATQLTARGMQTIDPFQYHMERFYETYTGARPAHLICVPRGSSFTIEGVELGLHGDQGPNGARGSVKNLSRIGTRVISGHGHSPAIEEGHYRTGTMTPLKLEYTGSVGSWLNTHCSIDAFGKRHLHTCVNGAFWK